MELILQTCALKTKIRNHTSSPAEPRALATLGLGKGCVWPAGNFKVHSDKTSALLLCQSFCCGYPQICRSLVCTLNLFQIPKRTTWLAAFELVLSFYYVIRGDQGVPN